ncbi:MAG TPA: hypothetical protein VFG28_02355 [Syntrophales bacterium]|nr:hypothetical protein [Syntrophales bacterium]
MDKLISRRTPRSFNRLSAVLAVMCLLPLISCTTVSNRVDRYESNYQQEYGPAEQAQKHPGVIHCDDEYVAMDLAMQDVNFNMDMRIANKTGGSISINWLAVLFELPKGRSTGAVPEGGDTTVVPALGRSQHRFAPDQPLSLFGIDSEESNATLGSVYADERIVIRVPVLVESIGGTKIYLFTYKYRSGIVDLSGDCARMN